RSAGTMLFSILAFLYVGRFLGGTGRFEDLMILTIWLQFLQIAALVATLALSLIAVAFMAPLILATAIYSLYITLHFLNEAHRFGSLGKSFGVILLSALLAVPFVLFLNPLGPV
ncbi:MAG: YIP1 family protein, partial [Ruegeria sp.]